MTTKKLNFFTVKFALSVVPLVAVILTAILFYTTDKMKKDLLDLLIYEDAIHEVETSLGRFHLLLEEKIAGDDSISEEEIFTILSHSEIKLNLLISGGMNDESMEIVVLDDEITLKYVKEVKSHLQDFKKLAKNRLAEERELSIAGSKLDQEFDEIFEHVMATLGSVVLQIENKMKANIQESERNNILAVVFWAMLVLLFAFGAFVFDKQKKLAQKELELSEGRLKEAQEIAKMGNWNWDIITGDLKWSDEIYKIFGLKPQEFGATYEAFLNTVHSDDRESVIKAVDKSLEDKNNIYSVDHRIVLPDKTEKIVHEEGKVFFDKKNTPLRMVGIIQDVTERKEKETKLKTAMKNAHVASKAKSEFLSSISHEIRTPMNSILGMTDLLSETELSVEQRDYLESTRKAGQSLLTLINDVLDLSKIEANKFEIVETPFSIHDVVENVMDVLSVNVMNKDIDFYSHIEKDLPSLVKGDSVRITQILFNLIGNAIKFTNKGEIKVSVDYDRAICDCQGDCNSFLFTVEDTGCGIDKKKQRDIFESFTQEDSTTSRSFGGTGLGLTISKKIIDLLKGNLWLESEKNEGSKFYFSINLQTLKDLRDKKEQCIKFDSKKVFILSHNAAYSKSLALRLEKYNFLVSYSHDLVPISELQKYDLLMVKSRGLKEDVKKLINDNRNISLKTLVLLEPYGLNEKREEYKELGVNNFIKIPCKEELLLRKLSAMLFSEEINTLDYMECKEELMLREQEKKILVAEDSADNRKLLELYFKKTKCKVHMAENGLLALDMFKKNDYDIVLMDMAMPVMDGYMSTKEIRKHEKENNLKHKPIIALTAFALSEEREKAFKAGCDGFLHKPIRKEDLFKEIALYVTNEEDKREDVEEKNAGNTIEVNIDFKNIIPTYMKNRKKDIQEINNLLKKEDFENIKTIGHNMKGTGTSYGFAEITRIGKAIDESAAKRDKEKIKELNEELKDYLHKIRLDYKESS